MNWSAILTAVGKVVGAALAGAATGYTTSGTWQGAAAGAVLGLGALFVPTPQLRRAFGYGTGAADAPGPPPAA